jgi:hypothetical protein
LGASSDQAVGVYEVMGAFDNDGQEGGRAEFLSPGLRDLAQRGRKNIGATDLHSQ